MHDQQTVPAAGQSEEPPSARLSPETLRPGELYLFHRTDPLCPAATSLWGICDRHARERLLLESSSRDLLAFDRWHVLPAGYRYRRLATRDELRDYIWNLAYAEIRTGRNQR